MHEESDAGQELELMQERVITSQIYPEAQLQAKAVPPVAMELGIVALPHCTHVDVEYFQMYVDGQRH